MAEAEGTAAAGEDLEAGEPLDDEAFGAVAGAKVSEVPEDFNEAVALGKVRGDFV